MSSPSTTPNAAWATLVTLGSYQPIICPAANTVCKCTDCREQTPTLVLDLLLQVRVFFPALCPSQCCFHKETLNVSSSTDKFHFRKFNLSKEPSWLTEAATGKFPPLLRHGAENLAFPQASRDPSASSTNLIPDSSTEI